MIINIPGQLHYILIYTCEFWLKNTSFLFQGKYYKQVHGAAMGFHISLLIANLFMEEFKVKALRSVPYPHTYGLDMWMTPLSFRRQNTVNNYYNTSTHQLTGPTYIIHYRGTKPRQSTTFPWHLSFSRSLQQAGHHCLQKAQAHWPILTLGQ